MAKNKKEFDIHVSEDRDEGGVRIQVTSDRLSEEGSYLSFKMTPEGLIIDHLDEHGNVIKSFSNMWDEVEELLK